jgi:type I restriction enzyme S subunit
LVAEEYIGTKVRHAEALRGWARELEQKIQSRFDSLHRMERTREVVSWRCSARSLSDERLDASFYSPPAVALDARLTETGALRLAHWIQPAARRSFDSNQPITYFEIGGVDTSTGCAWPNFVLAAEIPSRAEWSIQSWDILVATVRPERKNIGLVPPSIQGQLVATSGFAVLRSPSPAVAAYLWGYLRSDAATEQLMRWNTGAAYPAIDDDVPLRIWMPDVSDSKMAEHGSRWMKIPVLLSASRALVSAARLLVEALIERKVTEADLIAASRAPSADRALLSRLTSKGLDAEGLPLFPDLDALDALLAECDTKP